MTREELKKIILEEIQRALAELGAERTQGAISQALGSNLRPSDPSHPAPVAATSRFGVVILSGAKPPASSVLDALRGLASAGWGIEIHPSRTFRQRQLRHGPGELGSYAMIPDSEDESAEAQRIERASWVLFPDLSMNSMRKAALELEDSIPTRALAEAIRAQKPCLLLESRSPTRLDAPKGRLELIRSLEQRGAIQACPRSVFTRIIEALGPSEESRVYTPPVPLRSAPARAIVTSDDVWDAALAGLAELVIPVDAIVTAQAEEDAVRRGIALRRE